MVQGQFQGLARGGPGLWAHGKFFLAVMQRVTTWFPFLLLLAKIEQSFVFFVDRFPRMVQKETNEGKTEIP